MVALIIVLCFTVGWLIYNIVHLWREKEALKTRNSLLLRLNNHLELQVKVFRKRCENKDPIVIPFHNEQVKYRGINTETTALLPVLNQPIVEFKTEYGYDVLGNYKKTS